MANTGTGRTYDIHKITMAYKAFPITEFGEGDVLKAAPAGKDWISKQGTHGAVIRSRTPNNIWLVNLKLMYGSPAVAALMNLHKLDLISGQGAGVLVIKDILSPTQIFISEQAWMMAYPEQPWPIEAPEIEFEFECVVRPESVSAGTAQVILAI